MTSRIVVDSCVAFKWIRPIGEDGVLQAEALLDAQEAGEVELVAPATLFVELANAIRYSKLGEPAAVDLVQNFDALYLESYEPDAQRLARAMALAFQHDLAVYDALFLQLAEELDCPLVTADRKAFGRIDTPVEIRLI